MAFAALTIDLNARLAKFEQDMQRAGKSLDGLNSRASSAAAGLKTAFGALASTLSVGVLASFAKSGIDAADALNDMSQRTGVAVKTLAEWQLAAKLADTDMASLAKGVQKLSLSIGQAESGSKEQAASLQRLGVTARDPKLAFEQLADAVARSNDPIKTNADLQKVLGKNYAELLPLLQGGAQGLRDSAAASATFAESMAQLAPEAARFNDQLDLLKTNAAGAAAAILSKLVPSFNEWIAVGREVVKTGSLLDKVRFFALGNASDEIVGRVRKMAATAEAAAKKVKVSLGQIDAPVDKPGKTPKPTRVATGRSINQLDIFNDEMARNAKLIADETERIAGDLAFMRDVDLAQTNPIAAWAAEWQDAARSMVEDAKTPLEQFEDRIAYIDELMRRGLLTGDEYGKVMAKAFDDAGASAEKTQTLAQELGLTFTSAFEDAIVAGGDLSDVLAGLEQDIARILVRRTITEPLTNAIGGFDFSSILSSILPSANGNAFAGGKVIPFAKGGVVSSPTMFPLGLMGEAGPEAILPLRRGSDGKLGVSGGGSNVQVNVINNASGTQANATQREEGGMSIIDVVVEQVEGKMGRNLAAGRGIAPSIERRYGLNAAAGSYR